MDNREDMNIVIVGHVDHGKSTIIGRLLADTNSLPAGKLEAIKEKCRRNSKPFEYAFLLDALKDEQSQGITIDSARCFFKTQKRNYIIIDAPGHTEFLKNMITGASRAEAALIVIDANEGIKENSKRHGYMLSMLGIKQISVLVNKMDLVNYNKTIYDNIVSEFSKFLSSIGIANVSFIPVSGISGDNLVNTSKNMNWYIGSPLLEKLDLFKKHKSYEDMPFRMYVQDVYKFTALGDTRRIVAGTIDTGKFNVGDEITFYPSHKKGIVASIESFNTKTKYFSSAGYATAFTLKEQIYIRRGELAAKSNESIPNVSSNVQASIFWLGKQPMETSKEYYLKVGTLKVKAKLTKVIRSLNTSTLQPTEKNFIDTNEAAECEIQLAKDIAFDLSHEILATSRFVILDDYEISGGGIIHKSINEVDYSIKHKNLLDTKNSNVIWQDGLISYEQRCNRLGQPGLVIWFTGLSGAGKSTIAIELEKTLFNMNKIVYRLDGDNLRHGINSGLGFSDEDRKENIRRIAETAKLFKDAGIITLVSCISPSQKMRDCARNMIGDCSFIEVYVKADIEECIKRDPKGLYKKVHDGIIKNFTGISSEYEEPENPDIVIDTTRLSVIESVNILMDYIKQYLNNFN